MPNETCPNAFADAHNSKSKHMRPNILTQMFVLSRCVSIDLEFIRNEGTHFKWWTGSNRKHDQTWQHKGNVFVRLLAIDDILSNTFDPNIESSLASHFGNSKSTAEKKKTISCPHGNNARKNTFAIKGTEAATVHMISQQLAIVADHVVKWF